MSKGKFRWKSMLCMLLSINMLFNTLFSGWTVSAGSENQEPTKMIYLNSVTTQAGKVFGTLAQNLEKNTQYTISFQCKVEEGKFNNAGSDDVYFRVRRAQMRSGTAGATILSEAHVANSFNSYELDADGYTRRYTFTTDDTNTNYGIYFEFNRAMKMYIADFVVYKTSDATKANVLAVNADANVLTTNVDLNRTPGVGGWDSDYPKNVTFEKNTTKMTYAGNDGIKFYTAELMPYDAENVFAPIIPEGPKMIYLDSVTTQAGKVFGTLAQNLEKNTQYTIAFKCKVIEGKFDNAGSDDVYLRVRAEKMRSGSTLYEGHVAPGETKGFDSYELDADGYTRRYTFTTDGTNTDYGINFEFNRAMKMYIADFVVYKTSDATKANVLAVNADANVLTTNVDLNRTPGVGGWDSDYPKNVTFEKNTTKMTYAGNDGIKFYTAELMPYDAENVFAPIIPEGPKMIYLDSVTTQAGKVFGTLAQNLEKNTQYTIAFKCKVIEGKFDNAGSDDVYLRVRAEKMRSGSTLYEGHVAPGETKGFDSYELDADGYTRRYTFTTDGTNTDYGINFEFNRAMKMYIADFVVYKTSDTTKANVLAVDADTKVLTTNVDSNRTPGIGGWDSDYPKNVTFENNTAKMTYAGNDGTKFYTAELMPYDSETIFVTQGSEPEKPPVDKLPEGQKMIKLEVGQKGVNQIFGQNVTLEKGKKYTISFQYTFDEGTMDTTTFLQIKAKFGGGKYTTYHASNETGEKAFESSTYDKATGIATYTFTHKNDTGEYGVGFSGVRPFKMYLANVTMYETTDTAKKNILPSGKYEEESLKGWRSDYISAGDVEKFQPENSNNEVMYTATLKMYDGKTFEPDVEIGPKMIKLDFTKDGKNQIFGQNVTLEKGKKYTISFQYKFEEGSMNTTMYLRVKAAFGSGKWSTYHSSNDEGDKGFEFKEDEATCTAYYTFKHTQETGQYGVGFESIKPCELYIANMSMYETADASKKNLLPSSKTELYALNGWRSDYVQAGEVQELKIKNNDNVLLYTATLLKYDKNIFKPKEIEPTMIYIDAGNNAKDQIFGQNVKLEKGKTYTISFRYKFVEGDINSTTFLRVKDALKSGKYKTYYDSNSTGRLGMDVKYNKQTCLGEYTFKHTGNTGTYAVGFQFNGITKMYITDFKVYDAADKEQKNLLSSRGNEDTLLGWGSDWASAETQKVFEPKGTSGKIMYTAKVMPLDNNIFKPDPELPPRMLYVENNGTYRQLVQRVKVEAGQTYRFSFCVASPVAVTGMVMHTGDRIAIFNAMNPINEPDYKKDFYEVVYEFTLPATFGGEAVDTSNVFVGIQFLAGTIAYVFNPKLVNVNDKEQNNLYVNPGFNKGLDNWALSWGAWFIPGQQGMGVTEYEKEGEFKLQVMDYDEEKFITYYDDSRMNDGEWWSADDIVDSKAGTATIKGRFLSNNGRPIAKAKMVLKTLKDSFECQTDKDGKFSFDKLPAGFYELYYVDKDGNMIKTNFAQNIKDGYTVNVDVFASVSGLTPIIGFIIADVVAIGAIAGTVLVLKKRKKKRLVKIAESE